MKRTTLLAALVSLAVSACSTKQDPLAGQSDRLRNAQPPANKPGAPGEISNSNLLIDGPSSVTFEEGVETHFTLAPRSLLEDYDQAFINIENIGDFAGAQFDPATGVFSWTPPSGTTGRTTERRMTLSVHGYATSSHKQELGAITNAREISIVVTKVPGIPTIVQLADVPISLREGEDEIFHVLVKDVDGGVTEPVLQFKPPTDTKLVSLAPFINVSPGYYDVAAKLWVFECQISLKGELSDSSTDGGFTVLALSTFGRMSPVLDQSIKVFTSLDKAATTWGGTRYVRPASDNRIPFLIYNPKGEGMLKIKQITLPEGAQVACSAPASGQKSVLECTLIYNPPLKSGGARNEIIKMTVLTSNTDAKDKLVKEAAMEFKLIVEAP
jgi:hypothetical protein